MPSKFNNDAQDSISTFSLQGANQYEAFLKKLTDNFGDAQIPVLRNVNQSEIEKLLQRDGGSFLVIELAADPLEASKLVLFTAGDNNSYYRENIGTIQADYNAVTITLDKNHTAFHPVENAVLCARGEIPLAVKHNTIHAFYNARTTQQLASFLTKVSAHYEAEHIPMLASVEEAKKEGVPDFFTLMHRAKSGTIGEHWIMAMTTNALDKPKENMIGTIQVQSGHAKIKLERGHKDFLRIAAMVDEAFKENPTNRTLARPASTSHIPRIELPERAAPREKHVDKIRAEELGSLRKILKDQRITKTINNPRDSQFGPSLPGSNPAIDQLMNLLENGKKRDL
jgi:hypothetical protein